MDAVAELRYGTVAINAWTGFAYLTARASWGAFPGHTVDDVQSGIGVVHNALLLENPERSVVRGPFRPAPRSVIHRELSLSPKPPWFLNNRTAATTARRMTAFTAKPGWRSLPRIFESAMRGSPMRQLTGLDAQFLALETPRQSGHVSSLMVLDPRTRSDGALELEDIFALVAERLPLLAPFRWRLREVAFGLDYPYWIDDPEFDLEYHVRVLALPPPPTDERLATQVARIAARPLDRARPLWELYLIHGLQDDHVALLTKIHHAAVDGISGAEILGALMDSSPHGREVPAPAAGAGDKEPGELEMLARAVAGAPRYLDRVLRALPSTTANLEDNPFLSQIPGREDARANHGASCERCAAATRACSSASRSHRRGPRSTPVYPPTGRSRSASSRSSG